MYNHFFGFRERPFRLVPDPAYLFLSKGHEEALAHLTFAISQGEGFVEITGEVGTGKTTLCRAFLERLGEDTEVAYIFNPRLDAVQLLKAVNDEFGISSQADNVKDLIDRLNVFLLEKKAQKKKAILLIDEAQNLSMEVLEQVRLLANLETNTEKLLQIILVGQPELAETLDSRELRQLGQRITLSCHLRPLNLKEIRDYIRHRINVASQKPGVQFSRGAIRAIRRFSGGIPRLINIACDRALLTAFGLNKHEISGGIAQAAIRELAGRGEARRAALVRPMRPFWVYSLLAASVLFVLYHFNLLGLNADPSGAKRASAQRPPVITKSPAVALPLPASMKEVPNEIAKEVPRESAEGVEKAQRAETEADPGVKQEPEVPTRTVAATLPDLLRQTDARSSRVAALEAVLRLWRVEPVPGKGRDGAEDARSYFQTASRQHGLEFHEIENDLDVIRKLGLPAIVECRVPGDAEPRYLALSRVGGESVGIVNGKDGGEIKGAIEEFRSSWSGAGFILWRNDLGLEDKAPFRLKRDSVVKLKEALRRIGFSDIGVSPVYDQETADAVREIQQRHGLQADGIMGPLTKIILHNEIQLTKPTDTAGGPEGAGAGGGTIKQ